MGVLFSGAPFEDGYILKTPKAIHIAVSLHIKELSLSFFLLRHKTDKEREREKTFIWLREKNLCPPDNRSVEKQLRIFFYVFRLFSSVSASSSSSPFS